MTDRLDELDRWAASPAPVEYDCKGCGAHHVIDPKQVRELLDSITFVCYLCERAWHARHMRGYTVDEHDCVRGICGSCAYQIDSEGT